MSRGKNPFSLSFGRIPPEYIVRSSVIDQVVETFTCEPVTIQNYMITGVRGSGKTVTMTAICERIKELDHWMVIKISPLDDILDTLLKTIHHYVWNLPSQYQYEEYGAECKCRN